MTTTPPRKASQVIVIDMSQAKRHLYLVLKDCENGYTIRKIDVDSFDAGGGLDSDEDPKPLPNPPAFLVGAEHGQTTLFTALGTRILSMQRSAGAGAPGFDTATLGLVVVPQPQGDALGYCPTLVSLGGDRIYSLGCTRAGDLSMRHFEVLHAPFAPRRLRWSWSAVPSPPPFNPNFVASYAVHPDGRTIFFSVEPSGSRRDNSGTFSFDTKRLEWTCHGSWLLPFGGQGHYDGELDAWVGLCGRHHDDAAARVGQVCSCDVVGPGNRRSPPPAWKLAAEPMLCQDKERRVGAALVYMGDSRFCLVECVKHKKAWKKKEQQAEVRRLPEPARRLLHVTAFGLKYGKQGELTTARRRQRRSYSVPDDAANFLAEPVAFWM